MHRWISRGKSISSWFVSFLPVFTFFWIWALTLVFFIRGIDIRGLNVSIIKIIYVTLALVCVILFQFSRETWRKIIIQFWTIVIFYVVFVFLLSLLFQIPTTRDFIENFGINSEWPLCKYTPHFNSEANRNETQEDIGLHVYQMGELILFLLFEVLIIIIIVILQFLFKRTNIVASINFGFVEKLVEILDTFFDITKLTIFGIIMTCISKVNAVNFFIVIAAVVSMVLKRTYRYIIIQLISVTAAVILLLQMTMQLHNLQDAGNVTCPVGNTSVLVSRGQWIGIGKVVADGTMFYNVVGYIWIIVLVTVHTIVIKEENIIAGLRQDSGWNPHKMFNDSTYLDADKDFASFTKYLFKYGFYRYGIEFTYICMVLLIQARLDVWAFIYCVWLIIFILSSNHFLPTVWFWFRAFVVFIIPLQYASALGLWPEKCFGFQWETNEMIRNAFLWLYLPLGKTKPDAYKLFWDLIVFLFVLCQANVFEFERENSPNNSGKASPSIYVPPDVAFVTKPRNSFGVFRYALFCSLPIISAITLFLAATSTVTIFSIGYGIGFAIILWSTDTYFTDTFNRISKLWRHLIIFSVVMIFIKTLLQIPSCIFMDVLVERSCWIVQLLGMSCLRISTRTIAFLKVPLWSTAEMTENSCWYLPTTVGIEWDVCCFISLMFHNRFLHSNYYEEMAKQANLNAKFSDRAAKILEEFNEKELTDMRQKYHKNLEKIQKNMERLHQAQKRIRGIKISEPVTHQEAVTSGDYYMFQDADKPKKLDSENEEEQRLQEEPDSPHTPSVGKFMETVLTNDIEEALRLADGSTPSSRSSRSSKSSPGSEKSKKCFKCECNSKAAVDLREKMKAEEHEAEQRKILEAQEKLPKETSKATSRKSSKTGVIVENKELKPTIEYRKTSLPSKPKELKQSSSKISQSEGEKCACGCENCRCDASIWFTIRHCFLLFLKFVRAFIISCMSSLCQLFNKLSHDYRHIKRELEKEKERDKSPSPTSLVASPVSQPPSKPKDNASSQLYQVPIYIRLVMSTYDLILSHFNTVCFLSVLLLQIKNPTLFCLPLTMMVLFWGSLSVPRPTKRFWKIILTYTTCILILECIVRSVLIQYDYQWMQSKTYQLNQLFGIDKMEDNTIYYLIVILAVFLQRRLLINIGLWSVEAPLERGRNLFSTGAVSMRNFFRKLLYDRYSRIPTDVYTSIFLCDFINIFVFIFGFAAVTEKREDGVTRYLAENKIPPAMLVLFIVQCLMIFIDRWIYLRKHVVAKLIFQFVQIIIVHFCLFLLLPAATLRRFNDLFFPSLWYSIKCIYLLLSAYQIRCGYSASAHGHALCQSYNVVNMYVYQMYLVIPFVYELRAVTDWMWTETTLTLSEWLGMEDIFCTVFQLKCWRNYDNKYSYPRGQKVSNTSKFILGGGVVLLFFLVLLFPLAFFAFGRVAGEKNIPEQMELSFRIGSYQPLFTSYSSNIKSLETSEWLKIKDLYRFYPSAVTFLSEYNADDVGVIHFSNYSSAEWTFAPSFRKELTRNLKSDIPVKMVAEWTLHRKTENTRQSNLVNGAQSIDLPASTRRELLGIAKGERARMTVENICPKFLKVSSLSTSYSAEALMLAYDGRPIPQYGNLTFQIREDYSTWWEVFESYKYPKNIIRVVDTIIRKSSKDIIILTFNDKIFPPGIFSYFSAQGIIGLFTSFLISLGFIIRRLYYDYDFRIIGLYTSFLISLGFIIRRLCRGRTNQVFLDYLPNVDSILQLLLDIYFVREHRDSKLEEDLYAKLIFLFRSPETLIRWTRKPEDSD